MKFFILSKTKTLNNFIETNPKNSHFNKLYSSFSASKTHFNNNRVLKEKIDLNSTLIHNVDSFNFIRDLTEAQRHCLHKFRNLCMVDGKKNKSQKVFSKTLSRLAFLNDGNVFTFLMKAIDNVKPVIEVRRIRISGSTQLVPSILSRNRQESLAIRWIIEAAIKRRKTKKSMSLDQCLFAELHDAFYNTGTVRKRRDDLHKLAESNRGFAHYRWW
jgi:small subunit ribosomal protein S7